MIASGINLVMTVIGFAVSTMFIVFVCTRLICARIQLSASRRRAFPNASRSHHLSFLERHVHGLDPTVISSFPTKKFTDKYFSFEEDTQCTVCLAEYQEKDVLRILPYCGHAFHVGCIDIWLRQQSTCPVCRVSLRNSSDRKQMLQPLYSAPIRSHDIPDTFILDGQHCLFNGHGYLLATRNNHVNNTIPEDQISSEASDIGEAVCPMSEISNRGQHASLQESKVKLMESSSHQEIE